MTTGKTKIAVITCHPQPDYVRARSIRASLSQMPETKVIVIKNRWPGLLRYPEMIGKVLLLRLREDPDIYVLTFRGYELLPWVRLVSFKKPLIFDEFINPLEVVAEHRQQRRGTLVGWLMGGWRLVGGIYYFWLRRCQKILMDTPAHARYAAKQSGLPIASYAALPVSTDETVFHPTVHRQSKIKRQAAFTVFFYGTMVPLHGLEYVLAAAEQLQTENIRFVIVGGSAYSKKLVEEAQLAGAKIIFTSRVPFEELPTLIHGADLCLGGPFGKTLQSNLVVTGKTYQFLACAAPTLIARNTATQDLFEHEENCLLVPQADASAIASAIQWAKDHPQELARIGRKGQQLYNKHFSNFQLTRQMTKLLADL